MVMNSMRCDQLQLHLVLIQIESPYFKDMCVTIGKLGAPYNPPSRRKLSGELLQNEKQGIQRELSTWQLGLDQHGLTLVSDGWTMVDLRPLTNVLLVSTKGAQSLEAVNANGATKNAVYIADLLCKQIEAAGPDIVDLVIMDSGGACPNAGRIIEER